MKKALLYFFTALALAGVAEAQNGSVILEQGSARSGKIRRTIMPVANKAIGFDSTNKLTTVDARGVPGVDYIPVTGTPSAGMIPIATSTTTAVWSVVTIPTGTPASASAAGTAGMIKWDSGFIYICVATNTWKRAAIATW